MIARRTALLLPLALFACAAPPPPQKLALTIAAGADQNPDPSGHPTSVAIRLYQLASPAKFQGADVFALMQHEHETLGTDDLASEEIVVSPGETKQILRALKPGTQYVGFAVLFRDIDHAQWRQGAPVAATGTTALDLRTRGIVASVTPAAG